MISDRIKAHRSAPDVYEPPTFEQMADRIEELEAQLSDQIKWVKHLADDLIAAEGREARLKEQLETAESLRPIWAQGWTDDSQAAQVSSSALAQLWEMLGASNQTQAVEALAKLKGTKYYD